jgi:hypothetical protein
MTDPRTVPPESSGTYRAVTDGDLRDAMELREFLTGLGVVMQLPTRPTTRVNVVVPPPPARKKSRHRWLVPGAVLGCIAALALVVPAVMPQRNDPLPPTLLGSWHTRSPKYADRGFEIRDGALHMKRGARATDIAVLPIRRVRVTRGSSTAVVIDYQEDGVTQSLALTMHGSGGAMFVEVHNQPDVVWRKGSR